MISHEIVEEIKYRNDIEDVISAYVTLKRAGSNLSGRCPFHSEKTPSFTVFPSTRSFYCFGCGAGGDVITFVMRTENLEYPDALRFLAKRSGIEIPESETDSYARVSRERILEMNRHSAKFFHEQLKTDSRALAYLEKRGLGPPLIKHFGIGYAPDSFTALTKHLTSLGYKADEMREAFLCSVSKKNGNTYDIFRNRIMFPVIDVSGNIIAFGGRTISDDKSEAKYINTSDTPAFKKSRNLFALNFARSTCGEQLILCEGYMDVIALHGAGISNAVASCGTALTDEQARLMAKYTKSVVISYDSDEAGQRAADKAFSILGKVGLDTKILKVEGAKDPDEYIKKYGKAEFSKLLSASRSRFDFKFSSICENNNIKTHEGLIKAIKQTEEFISLFHSEVERDIYIRRASEKLGVSFQSMKNDVSKIISKNMRQEKKENERRLIQTSAGIGDRINPDRMNNIGAAGAEDAIIGVLSAFPELIEKAKDKPIGLSPDDFCTDLNRRVYEYMLESGAAFDIGALAESFTLDEVSRVVKAAVARRELTENGIDVVAKCAEKLRKNKGKASLSLEDLIASKRNKS